MNHLALVESHTTKNGWPTFRLCHIYFDVSGNIQSIVPKGNDLFNANEIIDLTKLSILKLTDLPVQIQAQRVQL